MKKRLLMLVICISLVMAMGSVAFAADDTAAGDTIWIKNGSYVYKSADVNSDSKELIYHHQVKIKNIITDESGVPAWYEISYSTFDLWAQTILRNYTYIQVENTSVEEPTDEPLDSPVYENFNGELENGSSVNISAVEGIFPENTVVSMEEVAIDEKEYEDAIVNFDSSMKILDSYAVDIQFFSDGVVVQPNGSVILKMTVPNVLVPQDANMVVLVHMADAGPEIIGSSYLKNGGLNQTFSFSVNSFSSYAAVFVNGKYASQKMVNALVGQSRYEIRTTYVDLFDYNPETINAALNGVVSDGKSGFHFTGYGIDGCSSNSGINNSHAEYAKQGIVSDTLVNGLPNINYLTDKADGNDAGVETGKVLFSATEYTDKKKVYNDIPFEIIYDNYTGYYEYKSSANHAQLNDNGTDDTSDDKIELYADTLSTENNYVATLDLSKYSGANDFYDIKASSTSFNATVKAGNARIDPYVSFSVDNIDSDIVGQIYIKAKVPASVGSNQFQIFFNSASESYTYIHDYTANGDWIEFVIDTSDITGWSDKTITSVRVDLFDSNKGTGVNTDSSYPIEISQISLIRKNYDAYATRGGFYPFSKIEESYPGNNTQFSLGTWESVLLNDTATRSIATRSIYNPSPSSESERYNELAYGTVIEFDFYIPVDKKGKGDRPLEYYFDGDDDLWVFVDNKLVLDIGGGHGAITGSVNFTEGTTWVDNAVQVDGYNSNKGSAKKVEDKLDSELYAPGKHTMKLFYLERGGSVSNCYMKYNLPQTPTGAVQVHKSVVKEDKSTVVESDSVLKNEEYTFSIKTQDMGENSTEEIPVSYANKEYYLTSSDGTTVEKRTSTDGTFTLKDGEYATFAGINENHNVTVTEVVKEVEVEGYKYIGTSVNQNNANTITVKTVKDEQKDIGFVNTYDELEDTFYYKAVNPQGCPNDQLGSVNLAQETIGKRVGVPVGSSAVETSAVKFVGWYSDQACNTLVSTNMHYVPTKNSNELWNGATYYAKFEFKYADLKITKDGIENLDYHAFVSDLSKSKCQSTIFNISGTSYSGDSVNMDVVIYGNNSVMIKHLPLGTYTVKEVTNWSWRYDPLENDKTVTLTSGNLSKVVFDNNRNEVFWLSGDNFAKNLFKEESQPIFVENVVTPIVEN